MTTITDHILTYWPLYLMAVFALGTIIVTSWFERN